MNWSPQQVKALDAAHRWLNEGSSQIFRLWGFAGTGKTTLARHLAQGVDGKVLFAAYTGKAALVMQQAGCGGATTLHRLIYCPMEKNKDRLRDLEQELADLERAGGDAVRLRREVAEERKRVRRPSFELNPDSPLRDAALLIVDEASMVDQRMGDDILSFRTPVLVLGDPFQLPPVMSSGYFTGAEPDVCLTEIHRQARDNPIIALATGVREGRGLEFGRYGESEVLRIRDFRRSAVHPNAQILVGRNETRKRANAARREERGYPAGLPIPGDRLVCLRNNHDIGLLNGSIWTVTKIVETEPESEFLDLVVADDYDGGRRLGVLVHAGPFRGGEVPVWTRRDAEEFDYGYALTVHKAQGSQWSEVLIVDESYCFRQDAPRHLYTAITRAQDKVTVVR